MLSPNDSSSSSSNSSTSTITSASTTTTTSTQSQSQSQSQSNAQPQSSMEQSERPLMIIDLVKMPTMGSQATITTTTTTADDSDPCTPTLPSVDFVDAELLEGLYTQCHAADSYERLCQIIDHVFSSVDRLSKSFVCRPGQERQHLESKSNSALNKEQLRQLEGEHDKDEDSTQRTATPTELCPASTAADDSHVAENADEADVDDDDNDEDEPMTQQEQNEEFLHRGTKVDFRGLRHIKRLLFGAPCQTIAEQITSSVIQLADYIRYMRLYRQDSWEQVLHCLVICFDMATNS